MNRVLIFILLILLSGCSNTKKIVTLDSTDLPVIIRFNTKYNFIYRVNLPVLVKLENNTPQTEYFLKIDYSYSPSSEGLGEDLYEIVDDNLVIIKNNSKKRLSSFKNKRYIVYSWYRLDTTKTTQQQFKPYIAKMLAENKDTLHIGTVEEFKQKHKELFEKLTKNDSISIQFLDGKKLGERITVPVTW
ncbi:MAG: hypothetical protein CR968_00205 [Flavobacteriia bacterium]|nr:MAG: hypothetical protein CR968_00205 [Flavobacteriia bacterium]